MLLVGPRSARPDADSLRDGRCGSAAERSATSPRAARSADDRRQRRASEFQGSVKCGRAGQQAWLRIALAEELKQEFISPRRLREWIDVHSQLHRIVSEFGWRINGSPPTYEQLHVALLAGLLGNIGCKIDRGGSGRPSRAPYLGARSIKFHLWPGSPFARKAGRWIVAGADRDLAAVRPHRGRHRARLAGAGRHPPAETSYGEPHWEKHPRAGRGVRTRHALWPARLPAAARQLRPIDPTTARTLFIRGRWSTASSKRARPSWPQPEADPRDPGARAQGEAARRAGRRALDLRVLRSARARSVTSVPNSSAGARKPSDPIRICCSCRAKS